MAQLEDLVRVRRLTATGTAKAIRVGAGVSLRELAQEVGVGAPTISRWESGLRSPRGKKAVAYIAALERLQAART
jgi:transcriptional regulator with XRE-family HTH domain